MGVNSEPCAIPPLQGYGRASWPQKRLTLLIEARGCPGGNAPGVTVVSTRADAVQIKPEIPDVRPYPLPLVLLDGIQPGDYVSIRAENDNVRGENCLRREVVDGRAITTQPLEPLTDRGVGVLDGYSLGMLAQW